MKESPGSSKHSSPGSGSGRKPQRTLESLWGLSGPQVSQHRSPEWLLQSQKYKEQQVVRQELAGEATQSLPGELQVAVLRKPHSGGKTGGRPATGPTRGVRAGFSSNIRPLGASVLRRDPSLGEKMAVVAAMERYASDPSALASHLRRELERWSGFTWKVMVQWHRRKEEFQSEFSRLKLGKYGLRPFGSRLAQYKKGTKSKGCRRRVAMETYQSSVLKHLRQWFEAERMYGHAVGRSLLRDFYIKFLQRELAVNKGRLLQLADTAGQEKEQLALEDATEAQRSAVLVLDRAVSLQSQQQKLQEDQSALQARLRQMESASERVKGKYMHSVAVRIGAHLRKPQRKTRLTPSEEWERVRLTWQSFDRAQYVAVSGTDEELLEQVPDPTQWRSRLLTVTSSLLSPSRFERISVQSAQSIEVSDYYMLV